MAKKAKPKPLQVILERKGDFYECHPDMNDGDVIRFASLVNIVMTQRNGRVMTGFPFHQIDTHINKIMDYHPDSVVTIHDADGGIRMITTGETGAIVKQLVAPQTNNNNTTSKNNNLMETNNIPFAPNFKYFDFSNAYIMLDGEYRQCQMKGYTHYYTDNEADNAVAGDTIYSLAIAGVEGVRKYKHEQLVGKLYHTQYDINNANKMNEREGTVRCLNLNGQKGVLNNDRKTYIVHNGQLEFVEVTPDEYKYDSDHNTTTIIHRKSMKEEVTFYQSKDDALAYNKITVRNHDGSSEVIGGKWLDVLPTPEQQEKVDAVLKALDELYASGCRMYIDSDKNEFSFVNANKALLQYDMDDDEFEKLEGFHLPVVKWGQHHVSCYIGEEYGDWYIGLIREKKEENA